MPSTTKHNKLKAGVIGDPISHSLSPVLHNFWLKKYGINGSYEAIHVTPEELPDFLETLSGNGFQGINITLPHKEKALGLVDSIDRSAQEINATNTIIVQKNSSLEGRNTDAYGFIQNLKHYLPQWLARDSRALILGAGGAAKAVAVGLYLEGCRSITIVNRTKGRAIDLASYLNNVYETTVFHVSDWENRHAACADCNLLVNTTQLGMKGQPPLDIDLSKLPSDTIVNDIVYNPLKTELLKAAEARGLKAVDGLGMLLWQAQPGFEAWFDVKPEVDDELRAHVLAAMGQE